jgi:hypothetical protein
MQNFRELLDRIFFPAAVQADESHDSAPRGLKLLHVTSTVAEADLLRQVMTDAGFRMEYVASEATGVFGTSGNSSIYIPEDQYDAANEFLQKYLNSEPLDPEEWSR